MVKPAHQHDPLSLTRVLSIIQRDPDIKALRVSEQEMEAKAVMVADVLAAMQSEEVAKLRAEKEVSRLQERAAASEVRIGTPASRRCVSSALITLRRSWAEV